MPSPSLRKPSSRASSALVATFAVPMVRNTFLRKGSGSKSLSLAGQHVAQQLHGPAAAGDEAHAHLHQAHVRSAEAWMALAPMAASAPPPRVRPKGALTTGTGL